jgi:hypothetical protein
LSNNKFTKPGVVPGVFAYIKALADGLRGVRKG